MWLLEATHLALKDMNNIRNTFPITFKFTPYLCVNS